MRDYLKVNKSLPSAFAYRFSNGLNKRLYEEIRADFIDKIIFNKEAGSIVITG